jgi:DnaA-homolog protein
VQQLLLALAPPPEPTLANFVVGRNGAAVAALRDLVAAVPAERFVYLWGEAGSGRTHLLTATLAAARAAGLAAARFDASSGGPVDLLVADDIDALDAAAQVRLFDACNRQRDAGGRLLAAGSAAPSRLGLRDDLRTRLASGLAFELAPLDEAERRAALASHARARGLAVPDEIFEYIARRVRRDMATQAAVLDALDRYSLEQHRPLTLPLARTVLQQLLNET